MCMYTASPFEPSVGSTFSAIKNTDHILAFVQIESAAPRLSMRLMELSTRTKSPSAYAKGLILSPVPSRRQRVLARRPMLWPSACLTRRCANTLPYVQGQFGAVFWPNGESTFSSASTETKRQLSQANQLSTRMTPAI